MSHFILTTGRCLILLKVRFNFSVTVFSKVNMHYNRYIKVYTGQKKYVDSKFQTDIKTSKLTID